MSSIQAMQCAIGVLARLHGRKGLEYCKVLSALASTCWNLYETAAETRCEQAKAVLMKLAAQPDFQGRYKPELALLKPVMNKVDYEDLDSLLSRVSPADEDFFAWSMLWLAISTSTMPMNLLLDKDRFDDMIAAIYPLFPEQEDTEVPLYPDNQDAKDQIEKFTRETKLLQYVPLIECNGADSDSASFESRLDWVFRTGWFAFEYNERVRAQMRAKGQRPVIGKQRRLMTVADLLF
jgi:hypothetical protein